LDAVIAVVKMDVAAGDEGLMDVDAQCNEVLACLPKDGTLKGVLDLAPVDFDKVGSLRLQVSEYVFFFNAFSSLFLL